MLPCRFVKLSQVGEASSEMRPYVVPENMHSIGPTEGTCPAGVAAESWASGALPKQRPRLVVKPILRGVDGQAKGLEAQ